MFNLKKMRLGNRRKHHPFAQHLEYRLRQAQRNSNYRGQKRFKSLVNGQAL